MTSVYDFSATAIDGTERSLEAFRGQSLLIVNTASKCGFTGQYKGLEDLHRRFADQPFEVLGFPCNQFGGQAPGTEEEIHEFCQLNYHTKFPQFKKIEVNGEGADPLYKFLKSKEGFGGFDLNHPIGKILDDMLSKADANYKESPDIKWNFTKFIIDRKGEVAKRFEPTENMDNVEKFIESLL